MAFGKKVKEIRLARGMSLVELAQAVGVTPQSIFQTENREKSSYDRIPLYAKALDCSIDDLFAQDSIRGDSDKSASAGAFEEPAGEPASAADDEDEIPF